MKKTLCIFVLISLILTSCVGGVFENSHHIIDKVNVNLDIGESYTLTVRDSNNKVMKNGDLLWSSDDFKVATVTGEGVVNIKGEGMCTIIARSKDNLEHFSSVKVFSPYKTVSSVDEKIVELDAAHDPFDFYSVAELAMKRYGKTVISFLEGKTDSVIIDLIKNAFEEHVYWYSDTELDCDVKDGIIYTVTDWSNSAADFDLNNLDRNNVYQSIKGAFSESVEMGVTVDDVIAQIKTALSGKTPKDLVYHLDRMDGKYEYRVVVRGDYTGFISREHYSNGLLSRMDNMINDITGLFNGNVDEVIENYAYTVVKGEIINLENIRICIEAREK